MTKSRGTLIALAALCCFGIAMTHFASAFQHLLPHRTAPGYGKYHFLSTSVSTDRTTSVRYTDNLLQEKATCLNASASGSIEEEGGDGEVVYNNLESAELRREQQIIKYRAMSAIWIIEPLIKDWLPIRVQQKRGDLFLLPKVGYTMGMFMASGLCSILSTATYHDRLSSDTYKRLNVIVFGFSFMLLSAFLDNIFLFTPAGGMVGLFAAYDGFVNGVRGFHNEEDDENYKGLKDVRKEIKEGIVETFQGMFKAKNLKAAGYLVITWLFTLVNILHNIPLFFKIVGTTDVIKTGTTASQIARLWVVSGIAFTLKDAADRGRLSGTTFIQLNTLGGMWAIAVSLAALTPKYFSFLGLVSDKATKVASVLIPVGIYFLWNGVTEILKKRRQGKTN